MNKTDIEALKLKIIKQQRDAYEISKALMCISSKYSSYTISTKIFLQNDKYIPITEIKELPEARISYDTSEEDLNFLKNVVIDNMEGSN